MSYQLIGLLIYSMKAMEKITSLTTRAKRDNRTPEVVAEEVFQTMLEIYVRSSLKVKNFNPDITDKKKANLRIKMRNSIKSFNNMLSEMFSNQECNGDDLEKEMQEVEKRIDINSDINKYIEITLAYAIDSTRAYQVGNVNLAWSYVADANFWAGQVVGISIDRHEKTSNASNKRHEKTWELEKEIIQWYKKVGYKLKNKDYAAEQAEKIFNLKHTTIRKYFTNL